jgi:hypothetical protein
VRYVLYRSFTRGLSQIWLKFKEESSLFFFFGLVMISQKAILKVFKLLKSSFLLQIFSRIKIAIFLYMVQDSSR